MNSVELALFEMPATCSVGDCARPPHQKALCNAHYKRWWRYGDPLAGGPMRKVAAPGKPVQDFPDGTRICNACDQRLPLAESFHLDAGGTAGRRSHCRDCHTEKARQWYAANGERQRDRQAKRRQSDPEGVRRLDAERYERDRDKRIALATQHSHKRRLRLAAGVFDPTVTRANLRRQYGDACFYCAVTMDFVRYTHATRPKNLATIEHVTPISRGGAHDWTNVVLACLNCNLSKNATPLDQWLAAG